MQVKVKRKARKLWSSMDAALARDAIAFGLDELDLWACDAELQVILRGDYPCGSYGDCIDLNHEIVVRVSKQSHWLKTLFHELVHVKQYINDELELEQDFAMWKGRLYKSDETEYWDSPWEVEARKKEEKLYRKYRKYLLTLTA